MKKKNGFTLIELLAVIIILAVIALIATPIVLNVVDKAKVLANQSSIAGYADATKLAVFDYMFMKDGKLPSVDKVWAESNVLFQGKKIECGLTEEDEKGVYYSEDYGVILYGCSVENDQSLYYFANGKVYTDKENSEFNETYMVTQYMVSKPELVDKLVAVKYENNNWVVADTTSKWYDYDKKEWANAVVLNSGVTKNIGQTVDISLEVAQMYVWIPRYEYKIPVESIGTTGAPNAIEIKFISEKRIKADEGYVIHPGFTFGTKEKSGIWMGKFESNSGDATCLTTSNEANCNKVQSITIKPNITSLRNINVSNMYLSSREIQNEYSLTGMDSHMSKYTEWTTASYLSNSIYGRCSNATTCSEVTINNSNTFITGNAANEVSGSYATGVTNAYDTENGQKASTTGNITGIYDMSGGAFEYVMGVMLDTEGNPRSGNTVTVNSGFNGTLRTGGPKTDGVNFPDSKYYDTFKTTDLITGTYGNIELCNGSSKCNGIFKELMSEESMNSTMNWNGDNALSVSETYPWFHLGGYSHIGSSAGVFASNRDSGQANYFNGLRVVLVPEK